MMPGCDCDDDEGCFAQSKTVGYFVDGLFGSANPKAVRRRRAPVTRPRQLITFPNLAFSRQPLASMPHGLLSGIGHLVGLTCITYHIM